MADKQIKLDSLTVPNITRREGTVGSNPNIAGVRVGEDLRWQEGTFGQK